MNKGYKSPFSWRTPRWRLDRHVYSLANFMLYYNSIRPHQTMEVPRRLRWSNRLAAHLARGA